MKHAALAALAVGMAFLAAPAAAFEGHVKKCYHQHWQEPEYKYTQHLVRKGYKRMEYRGNNKAEKVYYPPVYKEKRTKVSKGRYVLRQVACGKHYE